MKCLPDISYRYFVRPLVTVFVAPMTIGIREHFMFHIRWISMHRFLNFNLFSASLYVTLLDYCLITIINIINKELNYYYY
jgi:hypothetical protein